MALTIARRKEILILLRDLFIERNDESRGICYWIESLLYNQKEITGSEYLLFERWFQKQKPRKGVNSKFTSNNLYTGGMWWFKRFEVGGINIRIEFLNHLIENKCKNVL